MDRCGSNVVCMSASRSDADRTALLLQLRGFAAAGEPDVRDAVRVSFARMWRTVIRHEGETGLRPWA